MKRETLGFSMVEMLMAATILAIGILGLTLLQTYTIKAQTSSGSLQVATQVGALILDQAEMVGRNSILCSQNGIAPTVPNPNYFSGNTNTTYYNYQGRSVAAAAAYFTVAQTAQVAANSANGVVTPIPMLGGIAVVTAVVTWTDTQASLQRTLTLTRRINYATS